MSENKQILLVATIALISVSMVTLVTAATPPSWWKDPNTGTTELIYEKGSSQKCASEDDARQKAYKAGLLTVRKKITSDTNYWDKIHLVGADIAFESTQQGAGGWYSWVLVSYPRAQFDKALQRAKELEKESQRRIPIFVCPLSFGKESAEQFPEVVKEYKKLGYGNAIWQTVEDLLYEDGFEIVTAPSSQTHDMLKEVFGHGGARGSVNLPEKVLLCNMNFFEIKTESLSWGKLARNSEYHAELLLELYEVKTGSNVKIPSKGEARDKDLLKATQKAAEQSIKKLVKRVREK